MNQPERCRRRTFSSVLSVAALTVGGIAALTMAAPGDRPMGGGSGSGGMPILRTGITAPSTTIKLGFDIRGVVDKVAVKDNDHVTVGQALISLLDDVELATLNSYRLKADTQLQVAEAEQTYNVKKIEYERKKYVFDQTTAGSRGSAELEMRQAEAEMNIAQGRIAIARHEGEVAKAEADAQAARVSRMSKVSPIEGIVRQVIVKPGEQVDETKPVIEIVDLDPLYVEVTLIDRASVDRLKLGDAVRVRYQGETDWRDATVDRIDPVGDASSGTNPFRLSLPNPEMRRAGSTMEVQLPGDVAISN